VNMWPRVLVSAIIELMWLPVLFAAALIARWVQKKKIGFGPEPLINNLYHVKAVRLFGWDAESFITHHYFINHPDEFDVNLELSLSSSEIINRILYYKFGIYRAFLYTIFRYSIINIYFNGGPLFPTIWLWRVEPFLYKLAGCKIVVMPYGGDVQALSRTPNLMFKHTLTNQYPNHYLRDRTIKSKIELWTRNANYIIGGCDWVDYMIHWDTLLSGHFSIDMDLWSASPIANNPLQPLRILHAPNHRLVKGTQFLLNAVNELRDEGYNLELILLEGVPNDKVREEMAKADLIADQFIIGWYAMFAIEGMAMGKPVLCYLREDLLQLYNTFGQAVDLPLINTPPWKIKDNIKWVYEHREDAKQLGLAGREYIRKRHSLEYIGSVFDSIYRSFS